MAVGAVEIRIEGKGEVSKRNHRVRVRDDLRKPKNVLIDNRSESLVNKIVAYAYAMIILLRLMINNKGAHHSTITQTLLNEQ